MHALRVLEFESVRQRLQGHCQTSIAVNKAGELEPAFSASDVRRLIEETHQASAALSRLPAPSLGAVWDHRDAILRASKGGALGGVELVQIGAALSAMRSLRAYVEPLAQDFPRLYAFHAHLPDLSRLERTLDDALEPDGRLRDDASPALSQLRQRKRSAAGRILERIQSYTTGRTRDLLSDPIYTVRDGRYVIPLKSENRGKIRGIIHDTSATGQTVFLEPEDVVQLGNALREVESQERQEELRILTGLSAKVGAASGEIGPGIEAASSVDLLFAKARFGFELGGGVPDLVESEAFLEIQGGRHPALTAESAVPLNFTVGRGHSVLITGPNTGGKTVAIKTVGLFVLMAQSGLPLPAKHVRLGVFRQVWADIGDEQSLEQSLSTFSGHIRNIAEALKFLKPGALVLLDEIGAGTDPAEGAALAKSILRDFDARGAVVLASTHYGELKAFAYNTEGFTNAAMEFDPKSLRPTYRLIMGAPGSSQALRIAERYGIAKEIVEQARAGLGEAAQDLSRMIEQLEQSQRLARIAQGEADRRTAELRKAEDRAAKKLAEADEIRESAHRRAAEVIEAALREIRLEAQTLFEELKKAPHDPAAQEKVRKGLRELQEVGQGFARDITPKRPGVATPRELLRKGVAVRIDGHSQTGTLLEDPRGGNAAVRMGVLKITVPLESIRLAEKPAVVPRGAARPNLQLSRTMNAKTEIMLIGQRAETAQQDLARFLDEAVLAGLPSVRIVHGKGEGILRNVVRDALREHPDVANYRDGDPAEGGSGATIAVLQ